ncbi:uncharacterized protein LOC132273093 [Cornus florida]|uniref:uncharacterized protein LOC132273093 n=1 Tax=Cornus florida TaxID=4283 RepID=UPI002896CB3C|nr:uncharacterized protein LOC132273093 [Cornus florida]
MDTSEAPMRRILRSSVTQTRTETPSTSSAATQPSGEADGSNSISQQPIMEGDGNTLQTRPQPNGGPVRKGRGKAKNIALHKAQDLYGKDVPIPVEFGTGYIKPVGKNHNLWTAEVGIHARDKEALLKYKTWREIPDYERQVCYDHFKVTFGVDAHDNETDFKRVTKEMSERLRKYRYKLKNHFDKHLPIENARLHPYGIIDIDVWGKMCDWWTSPEFQVRIFNHLL